MKCQFRSKGEWLCCRCGLRRGRLYQPKDCRRWSAGDWDLLAPNLGRPTPGTRPNLACNSAEQLCPEDRPGLRRSWEGMQKVLRQIARVGRERADFPHEVPPIVNRSLDNMTCRANQFDTANHVSHPITRRFDIGFPGSHLQTNLRSNQILCSCRTQPRMIVRLGFQIDWPKTQPSGASDCLQERLPPPRLLPPPPPPPLLRGAL